MGCNSTKVKKDVADVKKNVADLEMSVIRTGKDIASSIAAEVKVLFSKQNADLASVLKDVTESMSVSVAPVVTVPVVAASVAVSKKPMIVSLNDINPSPTTVDHTLNMVLAIKDLQEKMEQKVSVVH